MVDVCDGQRFLQSYLEILHGGTQLAKLGSYPLAKLYIYSMMLSLYNTSCLITLDYAVSFIYLSMNLRYYGKTKQKANLRSHASFV